MNTGMVEIDISIPKEVSEKLDEYASRAGGQWANRVSEVINCGIDAKYKEFPNLLEPTFPNDFGLLCDLRSAMHFIDNKGLSDEFQFWLNGSLEDALKHTGE